MSEISLELPGGVKVLNDVPLDPRTRTDFLATIENDPTYKLGFSPIYNEDDGLTYVVSGGDATSGWEFGEFGGDGDGDSGFNETRFADVDEIKALKDIIQGTDVVDYNTGFHYKYDETSSAIDNGTTVLKPTYLGKDDDGRFLYTSNIYRAIHVNKNGTAIKAVFDASSLTEDSTLELPRTGKLLTEDDLPDHTPYDQHIDLTEIETSSRFNGSSYVYLPSIGYDDAGIIDSEVIVSAEVKFNETELMALAAGDSFSVFGAEIVGPFISLVNGGTYVDDVLVLNNSNSGFYSSEGDVDMDGYTLSIKVDSWTKFELLFSYTNLVGTVADVTLVLEVDGLEISRATNSMDVTLYDSDDLYFGNTDMGVDGMIGLMRNAFVEVNKITTVDIPYLVDGVNLGSLGDATVSGVTSEISKPIPHYTYDIINKDTLPSINTPENTSQEDINKYLDEAVGILPKFNDIINLWDGSNIVLDVNDSNKETIILHQNTSAISFSLSFTNNVKPYVTSKVIELDHTSLGAVPIVQITFVGEDEWIWPDGVKPLGMPGGVKRFLTITKISDTQVVANWI